jgi:putative photosynthetic complex assembly protein
MSSHDSAASFPRIPLYSAAALICATILLVIVVRVTGTGDLRTPQAAVTAERMLRFEDQVDGSITVHDANDGVLIQRVDPGTNGFLRGALRGLGRERKRRGLGQNLPFRLTARSDGRLLLEDPATSRLIDLGTFGPTNAAVFARLLHAKAPGAVIALAPQPGAVAVAVEPPLAAPASHR